MLISAQSSEASLEDYHVIADRKLTTLLIRTVASVFPDHSWLTWE